MIDQKKQKAKFLEHYFVICREHGFCIDYTQPGEGVSLCVEDWPQYQGTFVSPDSWENYKQELKDSIK